MGGDKASHRKSRRQEAKCRGRDPALPGFLIFTAALLHPWPFLSHESANPTSYLCWLQVGFLALETKLIKKTAKTRRQGLHRADLGPEYLQLVLGEPGGLCGPGVQKDRGVLQQASESGLAWAGRGRKGCWGRIWLEETGLPSGREAVVTQRSSWCRGTSATP